MKKLIILITMILFLASMMYAVSFSGGSGTEINPYQIANLDDLKELSDSASVWDKYFIQTADINAGATRNWNVGNHDGDTTTADSPMGFLPLGNENDITEFTGSYNGHGYEIDSLYINRPITDRIGLFGHTEGSIIDSLGMTNIYIIGDDRVGGLVGDNRNSSKDSRIFGAVNKDLIIGKVLLRGLPFNKIKLFKIQEYNY